MNDLDLAYRNYLREAWRKDKARFDADPEAAVARYAEPGRFHLLRNFWVIWGTVLAAALVLVVVCQSLQPSGWK